MIKRLNHGNPVQIAVLRNSSHTILHVNDNTGIARSGVSLLKLYSETPWVNPVSLYDSTHIFLFLLHLLSIF